ncbi:MAG: uroporphyrinogen-III synthase [Bacteroidota bacterium]
MNLPLKNKLFISTRPAGRSDEMKRLFENAGAELMEMPMIQIVPLSISAEEKKLVKNIKQFDWLILTSANGVYYFFESFNKISEKQKLPGHLKIAVIGNKTQKKLEEYGYSPDFVNPGNTAEDFSDAFLKHLQKEKAHPNILLALGKLARTVIQDELKNSANCNRIDFYTTNTPDSVDQNIMQQIEEDRYEMLIFTSPSGIKNFLKITRTTNFENLRVACIGETTARTAKENGIEPLVVAEEASAKGLVDSIIKYYN